MKKLLFTICALMLTACGAGQGPQIGVTQSSHLGQNPVSMCTSEYVPTECAVAGVALSASGANECDARNQLSAMALGSGVSYALTDVVCSALGL